MNKKLNWLVVLWLAGGCQSEQTLDIPQKKVPSKICETLDVTADLKIGGSETEYPVALDFLKACFGDSDTTSYSLVGGGSNHGFELIKQGKIHVANCSNRLDTTKLVEARKAGANLTPIMIGSDAIAIITHSRLGIEGFTLEQLESVFSGLVDNWKEIGGPDQPIRLFGRNASSGTYGYVQDKLLQGHYSKHLVQLPHYEQIIDSVKYTRGAIGYVSLGYVYSNFEEPSSEVYAVAIRVEGDAPYSAYDLEAVERGDYALTRPLFQYINGEARGAVKALLDFELSDEGQEMLRNHGFFPLNSIQKMINSKNGLALLSGQSIK